MKNGIIAAAIVAVAATCFVGCEDKDAPKTDPAKNVRVVCNITIKEDCRDAYVAAVKQVIPTVRAEKGCIEYTMVEDKDIGLAAQFPIRQHHITMIECWEDADALKAHLATEHMKAFSKAVKNFRTGSQLYVMKEVE